MRKRLIANALVCGAYIAGLGTGVAHAQSRDFDVTRATVEAASPEHIANPREIPEVARKGDVRGLSKTGEDDLQNDPRCEGPVGFCNIYFGGS